MKKPCVSPLEGIGIPQLIVWEMCMQFKFLMISCPCAEISNIFSAAQAATASRVLTKLAARADGAAPGDLLTEDTAVEDETCEIVQGSNVTLGEGQDAVQAYLIQAIKNNNGVGVLCLTDDYGYKNEDSRGFAYRLACFGYKYASNPTTPLSFLQVNRETCKFSSQDW